MRGQFMQAVAYASTLLTRREVFAYRDEALQNWTLPGGVEEAQATVLAKLRVALDYARSSNAYYAGVFASVGFDPLTMRGLEEISVLPIMTKDDIRRHRSDFEACESMNSHRVEITTGGSTGQPLKFSMSRDDYLRSVGIQMAGWHLAGYVLGDRVAVFGGASIAERDVVPWRVSPSDLALNRRQFSAADMDDDRVGQYWDYIERWRPAYLRGYPTAIAELCRHRPAARSRQYRPQAVLTTSEMLTESDRHIIETTLGAPVFDGWGLNDGGASAYECTEHVGMHVDMTRAYVETVDDAGRSVWDMPGRVVVTSLTNKAFPFVRYDTGDMGVLTWRDCKCGRTGLMLTQILGRSNDTLKLGDARISPSSTTVLFGRLEHLRRYHIVQDAPLHITVTFDTEESFDKRASEEAVTRSFVSRCPAVSIAFVYAALPLPTDGSKWRSVVVLDSARR
ncbi:phenylacetate--CoA ligase family protein [Candidatus Cryosericum septentrionale]|nr:phenylacetate--CoA ligase family protein [Candidatus Cryosericum septentrionale]